MLQFLLSFAVFSAEGEKGRILPLFETAFSGFMLKNEKGVDMVVDKC